MGNFSKFNIDYNGLYEIYILQPRLDKWIESIGGWYEDDGVPVVKPEPTLVYNYYYKSQFFTFSNDVRTIEVIGG